MSMHPAEPDTGILFRRMDIGDETAVIPGRYDLVSDTRLCTTLTNEAGVSVSTVEHLMAALAGCGVDNVVIEINAPEVPIMDGSSEPFVFLIDCAGLIAQDAPRRAIRVLKPVGIEDGGSSARIEPWMGSSINIELDFETKVIGRQSMFIDMLADSFREKLSRARTFGFLHEVEALQAAGLARGGSMENAVVISGDTVLNEGGLRFDDECARHKALDCVGDFYLAGGVLIAQFHGVRPGHGINKKLLRELLADESAWELVDMDAVMDEIADSQKERARA
jgi:UDP-3-O-[3-hydroxymyristoyl] N-acetylglucosamine deacetylase